MKEDEISYLATLLPPACVSLVSFNSCRNRQWGSQLNQKFMNEIVNVVKAYRPIGSFVHQVTCKQSCYMLIPGPLDKCVKRYINQVVNYLFTATSICTYVHKINNSLVTVARFPPLLYNIFYPMGPAHREKPIHPNFKLCMFHPIGQIVPCAQGMVLKYMGGLFARLWLWVIDHIRPIDWHWG